MCCEICSSNICSFQSTCLSRFQFHPKNCVECCKLLKLKSWSRTLIVGLNATAITSAAQDINTRFNISDEHFPNSFWPVTAWITGAALAPMVILPIMEDFGMRIGYLVIFTSIMRQSQAKTNDQNLTWKGDLCNIPSVCHTTSYSSELRYYDHMPFYCWLLWRCTSRCHGRHHCRYMAGCC